LLRLPAVHPHLKGSTVRRLVSVLATVALALGTAPLLVASQAAATEPGVAFTAADLPTWQTDGIAWSVAAADGLIFVGGTFESVRPPGNAAGEGDVARANLVVLDAATGAPTSCAPSVTLPASPSEVTVRALEVSPDGETLYIGGYFSNVGGVAQQHIAALDIDSCTVRTDWRPQPSGTVRVIEATSSTVYFGGSLISVGGESRSFAAAAEAVGTGSPGTLLPWAPVLDADVRGLGVSPDGDVVAVGGDFRTANGAPSASLAVVDAATGANVRTYGADFVEPSSNNKHIATDATGFYISNEGAAGGAFDGRAALDWGTYDQRWRDTCLGATQATVVHEGTLYAGHHAHDCTTMGAFPDGQRQHITAQRVDDPTLLPFFPNTNSGIGESIGPRGITVASKAGADYLVVVGEFTIVNGKPQQGITRFGQGPASVAPTNVSVSVTSDRAAQARIAWRQTLDPDDSVHTYRVYRDGVAAPIKTMTGTSWFWSRQQMTFVDTTVAPGSTHRYRVSVADGETVREGAWRTVKVATRWSAYAARVAADGAQTHWRFDEPSDVLLADAIGNNNATLRGTAGYRVTPAALTGDSSRALTLIGAETKAYTERRLPAPKAYTLETWIKTTTTSGGKILGFGNTQALGSSRYDKQIYMSNDGRLNFGVYTGSEFVVLRSQAVNDGRWHHVVATQGSGGMALYVNGTRVQSSLTTANEDFAGYWHLGGDRLAGWPYQPSSDFWKGSVDETAIYPKALASTTVRNHHTLGVDGPPRDASAPSAPGGLVGRLGGTDVALSWGASSDNVGVIGYEVHRSTRFGFVPSSGTLRTWTTTRSVVDRLPGKGAWYYRVIARDAYGNVSAPSAQARVLYGVTIAPQRPGHVQSLKVTGAKKAKRRAVTWSPPRNTARADLTTYRIVVKKGKKRLVVKTITASRTSIKVKRSKLRVGKHKVVVRAINGSLLGPVTSTTFRVRKP
jgi:hypothetical protein